jgi:cullin-associated NEDD8-dissociated protein 1
VCTIHLTSTAQLIGYSRYSDDEDTSYKIRRSATKLLAAVIHTRPDLLSSILRDISPVLIARFGDREQTVRLEVWATYSTLLSQVSTYGGPLTRTGETAVGGKRKREEEMEIEESPHVLLKAQIPGLSKTLLGQMRSPKTAPASLQAGFELLKGVLSVTPGSLTAQTPQIFSILKNTLSQPPTTTTAGLHTTCLGFLSSYFSTHPPAVFGTSLPGITPTLLKSCQERHPRVSSEAFQAFSSLLRSLKPVKDGDWVDGLYDLSVRKLSNSDTDTDVRSSVEQCIGTLWVCATEVIERKDRKEWTAICRTTGRTEGAVEVVSMVAREVHIDDNWVNGCVSWVMVLLQKSGRSGKADVFACLDLLLRRSVLRTTPIIYNLTYSYPPSDTALAFPLIFQILCCHICIITFQHQTSLSWPTQQQQLVCCSV